MTNVRGSRCEEFSEATQSFTFLKHCVCCATKECVLGITTDMFDN